MSIDGGSRARVAVLGAGVAGLSCALTLTSRGMPVDVFDQGSRGVGGRASSSRPVTVVRAQGSGTRQIGGSEEADDADEPLVFDHGCQFFTATHPAFKAVCNALCAAGHVARWDGRFGSLDAETNVFTPKAPTNAAPRSADFFGLLSADEVFVGVPTMKGLCQGLRGMAADAAGHWHVTVTSFERSREASSPPGPGGRTADNAAAAAAAAVGDLTMKVATSSGAAKIGVATGGCLSTVEPMADSHWPVDASSAPLAQSEAAAVSWTVSGVDHRQLDEGEAGSEERILGRYAAVVVTDVMMAKRGTPGSAKLSGVEQEQEAPSAGATGTASDWTVDASSAPSSQSAVAGAQAQAISCNGDGQHDAGLLATAGRAWAAMEGLEPSTLFSLMVAFPPGALGGVHQVGPAAGLGFDAAVVVRSDVVQLLVRDASKPGRPVRADGLECWVALSTRRFAEKVVAGAPLSVDGTYNPQTAAYMEAVTPTMVAEVRRLLGGGVATVGAGGVLGGVVPAPVHAKSQRWGNAFPIKPMQCGGCSPSAAGSAAGSAPSLDDTSQLSAPEPISGGGSAFIWDKHLGFAACGDFIAGAGVESAFLSGAGAGAAIADTLWSLSSSSSSQGEM